MDLCSWKQPVGTYKQNNYIAENQKHDRQNQNST